MLDERWVFHENAKAEPAGEGVVRRVLAYSKDLMCVENTFETGAEGKLHHHPHTQITYVVSGVFEFNIDGEIKTVKAGDTMYSISQQYGVRLKNLCRFNYLSADSPLTEGEKIYLRKQADLL